MIGQKRSDRATSTKKHEKNKAGDDGGKNQRKMDEAIEDGFAPEFSSRKQQTDENAQREAGEHRDGRNSKSKVNCRPFLIAQ